MQTKKFLRNIIIICFALHICLLLIIQFIFGPQYYRVSGHTLWDDGETFSSHARIISYVLLNKLPDKKIKIKYPDLIPAMGEVLDYAHKGLVAPVNTYQVGYITYFYSLIYAAFGYHPTLINLINILLNLLTGIIIFKICKMIFDEKEGCIALTLFLFNPVLFHYATTKTSESVYIFIGYAFIYFALLLRNNILWIFLITITIIFMKLFKQIYFIPMLIVFFSYLFYIFIARIKLLFITSISLILAILLFFRDKLYHLIINIFRIGADYNLGYQSVRGGLNYNLVIFGENYYDYNMLQWFLYFINSWYHMLCEPVHPNSIFYLVYYPFKILFVFLCLFAFFGLMISVRLEKKDAMLLSIFFILVGSIIALGSGNVGTMLRHRDIVTPIIFIFSSVFLAKFFSFRVNNVK